MKTFSDEVLTRLRGLSRRERQALRRELEDHIADHAAALEAEGLAPGEARAKAEAAMGDPGETAKELAKCYAPFWLWLGRVVNLLLALAVLLCLWSGAWDRLLALGSNLLVRCDPAIFAALDELPEDYLIQPLDLRMEVGEQVIHVYRLALDPGREEVRISFCCYPGDPFTPPYGTGIILNTTLTNQRGGEGEETERVGSMPGYPAWNYWEQKVSIQPEDQYVVVTCDYGISHGQMQIPLEVAP